jgi:hypothetical protein
MGPASFQGLDLLFLPARLKAAAAQGAAVPGDLAQSTQEPSATGAGRHRFFTGMIEALGFALNLYRFPILPLIDGPVKGVVQVGTRMGAAVGAGVEKTGIGDLSRQKGSAVRASDHKSAQRLNPGGAKAGGLQSQGAEGAAVPLWRDCKPLATPDLESSGFCTTGVGYRFLITRVLQIRS